MQSREAAINAMENLDEQHTFDASGTALSVRWADPELQQRKKAASEEANAENRVLFFAKVLRSTTEDEVRHLFARFGKVQDVNLFRAFQGAPTTKGCGLVSMSVHSEAVAAIAALDGKYVWEGMDCPMVVKWMDTALQRRRREQHLASIRTPAPLPSASIGGILGGAAGRGHEQLQQYGGPMGGPSLAPLEGAHSGAPGMTGPGPHGLTLVQHPPPGAAGLGGAAGLAMPVGASMLAAGGGGMGVTPGGAAMYGSHGMAVGGGMAAAFEPVEMPPPGCNPDAIKLFVGNIPKSVTEDQLLPLFQSIGKVVELVIVYDKVTHESKGSAFVWYASRADSERAILQFNMRHCLADPSGTQDRPLVVRRAKARNRGPGPNPSYTTVLGQTGMGGLSSPYYQRLVVGAGGMGGHTSALHGGGGGLSVASLAAGMEGLHLIDATGGGLTMGMAGGHLSAAGGYAQPMHVLGGGGGAGGASAGVRGGLQGQAGLYDAYGAGEQVLSADYGSAGAGPGGASAAYAVMMPAGSAAMGGHAAGGGMAGGQWDGGMGSAAGGGGGGNAMMTLALNAAQLSAVNQHLFSVQAVSGAGLQLSPGAPGLFNLVISGSRAQVESARNLVATVLGGAAA